MYSDKADRSPAIAIEMLYSTCIWETGTVKVFDLIDDIILRVSTTNWQKSKIDSMYIGKGGALNRDLGLNKQLLGCLCAYLRDISGRVL